MTETATATVPIWFAADPLYVPSRYFSVVFTFGVLAVCVEVDFDEDVFVEVVFAAVDFVDVDDVELLRLPVELLEVLDVWVEGFVLVVFCADFCVVVDVECVDVAVFAAGLCAPDVPVEFEVAADEATLPVPVPELPLCEAWPLVDADATGLPLPDGAF
ncbi:hypothetical protein JZ785_05685 [Alicyclobacillus curvatus]|nr:hypothetical protein JZ785_05685 [Alicyclobacillus curvatus]